MSNPDDISIQISLYPLGDTDITKSIFELLNIFQHYGPNYGETVIRVTFGVKKITASPLQILVCYPKNGM